ncbi:MAG: flagellar hook assembly protein FlgD [Pseudomonadales bacterium]|nr:flagellar hook assembly protein FlgD [Pseudomonadales bacterium]
MEIPGIRSVEQLRSPGSGGETQELGKNEFLKLMIAQMNNQDPLDPAKNEDFIAQLAQFSTVEGIENLNGSMAGIASAMQSSLTIQASSLVGRSVMVPTSQTWVGSGGTSGSIDLPESSANVRVDISRANGEHIRTIDLGPRAQGRLRFAWDGRDAQGTQVPQGAYNITAHNMVGTTPIPLTINLPDEVVSVSIDKAGVMANLAGGSSIPAVQIQEIQ